MTIGARLQLLRLVSDSHQQPAPRELPGIGGGAFLGIGGWRLARVESGDIGLRLWIEGREGSIVIEENADFGTARDIVLLAILTAIWRIGEAVCAMSGTTNKVATKMRARGRRSMMSFDSLDRGIVSPNDNSGVERSV